VLDAGETAKSPVEAQNTWKQLIEARRKTNIDAESCWLADADNHNPAGFYLSNS
jgi:hypothetical protein